MDEPGERDLCLACNRSKKSCFCGLVKPFATRTRFVLLMHPKEFKRQKTGTGRLTRVCLQNSEIVMGEDFSKDARVNSLIADPSFFPALLYPGLTAIDLSAGETPPLPPERRLLIFVIDGTWSKAKKMMRLSRNLHTLPRISFTPAAASRFTIKQQPHPLCVSTIEAVHTLLGCLDRLGLEDLSGRQENLLEVLDGLVAFQKKMALSEEHRSYGTKKGGYSDPKERKPSKKWTRRSFFFKG